MMISGEAALVHYLRSHKDPFTARQLNLVLAESGTKMSISELTDYLESEPLVFPLEQNMYLTRAGAFSNQFFSFVPQQSELDQKAFIPGDRCLPFVDYDMLSSFLHFEYKGHELSRKVVELDRSAALSLYSLYGDEYASQYIAADPVNKSLNLVDHEFELPSRVQLTSFSLECIIKDADFKFGDRILCRLKDWDKGIIEIFPLTNRTKDTFTINADDIERQKWNELLENSLLDSFKRLGPCASIEEQLANVFYEHRRELCTPVCGSITECLAHAKNVSMELFGVETRLWRSGQDVPAVGEWNRRDFQNRGDYGVVPFSVPNYIIDTYLTDYMYQRNPNILGIVDKIFPRSFSITPEERKVLTLNIVNRNDIIKNKYNWFADFVLGGVRHQALELYSRIGALVYEIDCAGTNLELLPQQELVTLSQLFTHITHILETIANDASCATEDANAIQLSLDGMEYNFEDIKDDLRAAAESLQMTKFEVI